MLTVGNVTAVCTPGVGLLACALALLRARHAPGERFLWQRLTVVVGVVILDATAWQVLAHTKVLGPWEALVVALPWIVIFLALYGALVRWNRYPTVLADPHDTLNGLSSVLVATALGDGLLRLLWASAAAATWWELPVRVLPVAVLVVCLGTAASLPSLAGLSRDRRYWLLTMSLAGLLVGATGWLVQLSTPTAGVPTWAQLAAALSAVLMAVAALAPLEAHAPRPTQASDSTHGAFGVLITSLATLMMIFVSGGTALSAAMAVAAAAGSGLRLRNNVADLADLAQVRRLALTDDLTGLANRRALLIELSQLLTVGQVFDLALLDLDRFKEVNDGLGHQAGDELIAAVARRLDSHLPTGHLLARLGGDEFAVVLQASPAQGLPSPTFSHAAALGEAITRATAAPFLIGPATVHVTCSVGLVTTRDTAPGAAGDAGLDISDALSADHAATELLRRADAAMYQAKRTGTGVFEYDRATHLQTSGELILVEQLRSALAVGELVLHHQPQICATTGVVRGVEALVRWQHPSRGLLMPGAFLESAEAHGLMGALSDVVLALAVEQLATFRAMGINLRMSVNLSASNLLDSSLPQRIASLLHNSGIPSAALVLEVTESVVISDPERSLAVLEDLAQLGVGLSIDDYGTGYSSLAYLQRLPVHELKLDRSFTSGLLDNPRVKAVVASAVNLAHALDLRVIAEGVEDDEVQEQLQKLGCDELQGYLYSPPLPALDFMAWMTAWSPTRPSQAPGRPFDVPTRG